MDLAANVVALRPTPVLDKSRRTQAFTRLPEGRFACHALHVEPGVMGLSVGSVPAVQLEEKHRDEVGKEQSAGSGHMALAGLSTGRRPETTEEADRAQETVTAQLRRAHEALKFLPSGYDYLSNRMESLTERLEAAVASYAKSTKNAKQVGRFLRTVRHPDNLPLLKATVQQMETATQKATEFAFEPADADKPTRSDAAREKEERKEIEQPDSGQGHLLPRRQYRLPKAVRQFVDQGAGGGTLVEQLKRVFETASQQKSGQQGIKLEHLWPLIQPADQAERDAVSLDDELIEGAARYLAPEGHLVSDDFEIWNDFPRFAKLFRLDQTRKAGSTPAGPDAGTNPQQIDQVIDRVLGSWIAPARSRKLSLATSALWIRKAGYSAAEKSVTGGVGGAGNTAGFTANSLCFIKVDTGSRDYAGTLTHEAMHLYAKDAIKSAVGGPIDEGITELFAREVTAAMHGRARTAYAEEIKMVARLAAIVGRDTLGDAYFLGAMNRLEASVVSLLGKHGYVRRDALQLYKSLIESLNNKGTWAQAEAILATL